MNKFNKFFALGAFAVGILSVSQAQAYDHSAPENSPYGKTISSITDRFDQYANKGEIASFSQRNYTDTFNEMAIAAAFPDKNACADEAKLLKAEYGSVREIAVDSVLANTNLDNRSKNKKDGYKGLETTDDTVILRELFEGNTHAKIQDKIAKLREDAKAFKTCQKNSPN